MNSRNESNMSLFLTFCYGDGRIVSRAKERKKMGPSRSLDFPLFRYTLSLKHRLSCVSHCLKEVEDSLASAATQHERLSKHGLVSYDPFLILVHKYQVLADEMYGTMENISAINSYLYPTNEAPPWSFREQMMKIRASKLSFSDSYDSIVKGDMEWYEEVLRIRRNSTHFVFGLGVFLRDEDGKMVMGYHGHEVSEREGKRSDDGVISNRILESSMELYSEFEACISAIGGAWLTEIDPNARGSITFVYPDRIESREFSLAEYRSAKEGKLINTISTKKESQQAG